ncbi:MAG: hypothetical protein ACFFD4_21805 [Candidatus Odinarchaeota archaeon]
MAEGDILQLLTVCCGIFSLVCSLTFVIKDRNALINRLLFLTFGSWAVNIFFLGFVYGQVFDVPILDLLRDIDITFGIMSGTFLFLSGFSIYYGDRSVKNWKTISVASVVTILLILIAIPSDYIDPVTKEIITPLPGVLAIFLIPGLIAIGGVVYFFQAYRTVNDDLVRKRILFFILGSLCLICGAVILGLRELMPVDIFTVRVVANILYVLGPVNILWAFYGVKTRTT